MIMYKVPPDDHV